MTSVIRAVVFVVTVAFAATLTSRGLALDQQIAVTPKNALATGFTVTAAAPDSDMIRITIVRDLAKAQSFPTDSPNELRRNAGLRIIGEKGLLARCRLEPRISDNAVAYSVDIARAQLQHSRVIVHEFVADKDPKGERQLGGAAVYEFDLSLFVDPSSSKGDPSSGEDGKNP